MENSTSEQQLKQLLDEGKINESEFQELLSAMQKPSTTEIEKQKSNEPEFMAYRKRLLIVGLIICIFGLWIGLFLKLPYVWILSLAGIIICIIKRKKMNNCRKGDKNGN